MAVLLFRVPTPVGFTVAVTESRWHLIVDSKHPAMRGQEKEVELTLRQPDQVRRSRRDPFVYLFYRGVRPGRWVCVVAKRQDAEGFLVTTYPTDSVKEGELEWSK